jgi:hypothetical protein
MIAVSLDGVMEVPLCFIKQRISKRDLS